MDKRGFGLVKDPKKGNTLAVHYNIANPERQKARETNENVLKIKQFLTIISVHMKEAKGRMAKAAAVAPEKMEPDGLCQFEDENNASDEVRVEEIE